ncbi:hypothetical protein BDR06DRAFT_972549 [Suillus hirtellus]|nr:hypothetical protein BDR06DRAFT_972549 [Suillus hirtellus]
MNLQNFHIITYQIQYTGIMSKHAVATLNDDAPTAKHIRIDEGSQIAPLANEHVWRILEEFLTTYMTYSQMEETFLSYLKSRDVLFSGDGNDKVALDNLHLVKYFGTIQQKLKNPYLNLDAQDDNEEEEEEEEEEGNNNNGPSKSCKVTHLPGSSLAAMFATVIDHLVNKFEDTQNNSSQNQ